MATTRLEGSNRRAEILRVAAELFADRGIAGTSVREIADRVGILSGSLYHHFGSKDDMVTELILDWLDHVVEEYEQAALDTLAPREAIEALIGIALRNIEEHPHAVEIYQRDTSYLRQLPAGDEIEARAARIPRLCLAVLEDGVARGEFRDDVPVRILYNLLRDALWRSVTWFDPAGPRSTQDLVQDCVRIFLDGFAARGSR